MIEQLVSMDFITLVSLKFDFLTQAVDAYLAGASNIKVVSLILMMLALILFLFLIIIIYVRNIIFFVRSNNPQKNIDDENASEDDKLINLFNNDEQQELERELQKELDLALAERREKERVEEEQKKKEQSKKEKDEQKKAKKEAENEKKEKQNKERSRERGKNKVEIDLDWQKGRIPPAELAATAEISQATLSYQQSRKELGELLGLAMDMLGRGVDDLKIAQTLNYKSQGLSDENEILKTIDGVKYFISVCLSGKFGQLEKYAELPDEEQALYHLANGDPSLALALLENLMDENIDRANASASEEKRQKIYSEVSAYACCFGSLSEINDIMLATSAYELAIELQSANVTARSRLGDVYKKANSSSKVAWAYQNVLNFADGEIDIAEIANANKHLSEHLYAEGNSLQAAKLYNSAKQYYDSLGISRRLDKQELEIIEIIESNREASLEETIHKLLGGTDNTRN